MIEKEKAFLKGDFNPFMDNENGKEPIKGIFIPLTDDCNAHETR